MYIFINQPAKNKIRKEVLKQKIVIQQESMPHIEEVVLNMSKISYFNKFL